MSDSPPTLYCVNHPQVETTLRCNRCEKPICPRCAISTPTGYRCKDCVRGQQKAFETAAWYDYPLAIGIAAILSFIGSRIVPAMGFFTLFLSPIAGVIIAELARLVTRRRRSRRLYLATAAAAALGSLPFILYTLLLILSQGSFGFFWQLAWQVVYMLTVTSTVYYRLSGISLGR